MGAATAIGTAAHRALMQSLPYPHGDRLVLVGHPRDEDGSAIGNLGWTYLLAGDLENAERYYREALRLDPASSGALLSLGFCLELRNAPGEAMQSYRRAMQINGVPDAAISLYDREFAAGGLQRAYAAWLEKLKTSKTAPRFIVAFYAARAGRSAEAIEYLRQSVQRREPGTRTTLWPCASPPTIPTCC